MIMARPKIFILCFQQIAPDKTETEKNMFDNSILPSVTKFKLRYGSNFNHFSTAHCSGMSITANTARRSERRCLQIFCLMDWSPVERMPF